MDASFVIEMRNTLYTSGNIFILIFIENHVREFTLDLKTKLVDEKVMGDGEAIERISRNTIRQ